MANTTLWFRRPSVYICCRMMGLFKAYAGATAQRLRILTYHGLCEDKYKSEAWIPSTWVTTSQFDWQMTLIAKRFHPIRLVDALKAFDSGKLLPPMSVAVTFDDGYDSSFRLGGPILQKHKIPATVYITTGWIGSEELFPHDRLRLLRLWQNQGECIPAVPSHLSTPIDSILDWLSDVWPRFEHLLTAELHATLRPASWAAVANSGEYGFDIGAHTVRHAILGNELPPVRTREIEQSVAQVRALSNSIETLFSYPNGGPLNFDETDASVLKRCGCLAAVSTIRGLNTAVTNRYALKRLNVGMGHDRSVFEAEVSGFRTLLKRFDRRKTVMSDY